MTCIANAYKNDGCVSCREHCGVRIALSSRQKSAQLPADYLDKTLENNPVEQHFIERHMSAYVDTFARRFEQDGDRIKSLYFYSESPGTGKTTLSAILLNEWLSRGFIGSVKRGINDKTDAYFMDINEWQSLYNKFNRPGVPQEITESAARQYYEKLERAKKASFVVMDDIGVRSSSEAFRADLHDIINHRTVNNMPTIYTSNIALSELAQIYDKRLADRVRDMCLEYVFEGESHRGRREVRHDVQ